jgi:8-hydroxy-5-deazaflavin:NADPH oxidoreductase
VNSRQLPELAVLGGTGHLGHALARRWVLNGYSVIIGSRDATRAAEAALALGQAPGARVRGATNIEAARAANIVVVTVPFASQESILTEVRETARGKLVVDTTVPLIPPKVMRVQLPEEGSAALRAQRILGRGVTVVAAFHNVAAHLLARDGTVDCDVLVFGEKKDDRERVVDLARDAQLRGVHGGSLANSAAAEALTSVLIFVNKHYGSMGAGLRITGLPDAKSSPVLVA